MLFSGDQRLVGIAKMASQSDLLQAKSRVEYFEIAARSVLNRCRAGMPFRWTINTYRGCEFGCKYCYARYTHEFMERDAAEFEDRIYAKAGVAEILRRELRKIDKREAIAIGTATDPYQPAERRFGRTRSILEVFAKERGWRVSITTKSDLIQRDVALLAENGICVGVFPNPILPLITDRDRDLDRLAKAAKDAGAQYFGGGVLFLMPSAQKVFFPFLRERFPHLVRRYEERFRKSPYLRGPYTDELRQRVRKIRERYGLESAPVDYRPELWEDERQQELFPIG